SRNPPKVSAYALITHCRSSCENPRSTLIEGNATFTIAMSRTTMNCTALSNASASHLRLSEVISRFPFPVVVIVGATLAASTCKQQVETSQRQVDALHSGEEMAKRYDQYCPVAHALDLVGERWSILIVKELMQGPQRYTDLAEHLPGIGTNILAARL